jgi:acyl carrier protein
MEMRDEIFSKVQACVADSLALDPEEVRPESRLFEDLGANSLDFIDILFMLEKEFRISVQETELNVLTRLDFSSPQVMKDGHLTRETVAELETWLPSLATLPDRDRVTPKDLFSQVTIETMCAILERRLAPRAGG